MPDRLKPNEHLIPLERAIEMTRRYRENKDRVIADEFKKQDILPISETFNKEAFTSLFANPLCKAIRICYGMSEDLQTHAIIVGVNEEDQDMLPVEGLVGDTEDPLLENGIRCPPNCPTISDLNTP